MSTQVVFMDNPDDAQVGVWKSSLSDDWGIYLEFVKKGRNPEKLMIRVSVSNPADLVELAHLIENTASQTHRIIHPE